MSDYGYTIEIGSEGIATTDVDKLLHWSKNRVPETFHGLLETVLYGETPDVWHAAFWSLLDEGIEVHAIDTFWQRDHWQAEQTRIALLK